LENKLADGAGGKNHEAKVNCPAFAYHEEIFVFDME
jgi:hypothetical protein